MNLELYDSVRMKNSNKYYVLALHNVTNELTAQYIGEYADEDAALSAANSYGRKNNSSIVWTVNQNQLTGLLHSIENLNIIN